MVADALLSFEEYFQTVDDPRGVLSWFTVNWNRGSL